MSLKQQLTEAEAEVRRLRRRITARRCGEFDHDWIFDGAARPAPVYRCTKCSVSVKAITPGEP